MPIATGAALANRYFGDDSVVCCFAGDGAYANGVVLESLNFAAQSQFTNHYADGRRVRPADHLPHLQQPLRHDRAAPTTRWRASAHLAQRAAGFADNRMHAEVVNGMNPLAVRDAVLRGAKLCREGQGPVLIEADCYRYWGHSLSDPRNEYRTKEEEAAWKAIDPIETYKRELIAAGVLDADGIAAVERARGRPQRPRRPARRGGGRPGREGRAQVHVHRHEVRDRAGSSSPRWSSSAPLPEIKRVNGEMSYKDAIKEALVEEMRARQPGGALWRGRGRLRRRVQGHQGTARGVRPPSGVQHAHQRGVHLRRGCGAAMNGLRPVVELMYFDFALMSSDQISNQAAKWHYMSGAQTEVPLVIRASAGAGKGYGGQHSQTLESIFCHIPGLYVVYPATPHDAKGMLKSAIRDNNPVLFVESQALYGVKGPVPEGEYLVPLGVADVKREGSDITFVAWGPMVHDCLKAAEKLKAEKNVSAEVIDLRSLVPLDMETVLRSVQKTGRCVVASQAIHIGSYTGEIASTIAGRGV